MLLLYGSFGINIAVIPLIAALVICKGEMTGLQQQVERYKDQEEQSLDLMVWSLTKDVAAGDILTGTDLKEKQIRVFHAGKMEQIADPGQIIGKAARIALKKGTIVQQGLLYEGELCTNDTRITEISFVELPSGLAKGVHIDLRISYPNGEDYIVVSHKKVLGLSKDAENGRNGGLCLALSEEEIVRLSAARADVNTYRDTTLYVIQYQEDFQEAAVRNYPTNSKVYDLLGWDPNVVDSTTFPGEEKRRILLERDLQLYRKEQPSDMTDKK